MADQCNGARTGRLIAGRGLIALARERDDGSVGSVELRGAYGHHEPCRQALARLLRDPARREFQRPIRPTNGTLACSLARIC